MSGTPFRTRRFVPTAPQDRPRRSRQGVRLVVTDGESVLMLRDSDPGIPGSGWWVTPGGGLDPEETLDQAAIRELAEETGLIVDQTALLGPVLVRIVTHGYSDQILTQHETFYVVRCERFEPIVDGHTDDERLTVLGLAWLPLTSLDQQPLPVWPADLADVAALADQPERWPVVRGSEEESTVPVTPAVQR